MSDVIAVHMQALMDWGCPYCGYRSGSTGVSGNSSATWRCGECEKTSIYLGDGVEVSAVGLGTGKDTYYPVLESHPREGTPSHGSPDNPPAVGGEYFSPRGIGLDSTPGCFVCGGKDGLYDNVSGFVKCKAAGQRVVAMFCSGARLDYRKSEPDYVQVKVGACKEHLANLKALNTATSESGGIITQRFVDWSASGELDMIVADLAGTVVGLDGTVDSLVEILDEDSDT
jgi:hypothetical protein